jgi:hypothetical protein
MKKINTTLATLALVFFMSASSIANSFSLPTGDGETSALANRSISGKITSVASKLSVETKFSYLRFDVNKFMKRSVSEVMHNSLDYLRFNVNEFVTTNEPSISELPVSDEFNYLRFDASAYTESENTEVSELPVSDLSYLKFDVNNYIGSEDDENVEMPASDFDYLRFDVSKYSNASATEELPVTE